MLKQLYQLQLIETKERHELEKQQKSNEFQQLRKVKADFTHQKDSYLQLEQEIAALDEQLASFPAQMAELEEKISAENAAIYDGSVVNAKELAAREAQIAALTEKLNELLIDYADHLLLRRNAADHLLAQAFLAHLLNEAADDLVVYVGLEQSQADFAKSCLDVLLIECAYPAKGTEYVAESVGKTFKHN